MAGAHGGPVGQKAVYVYIIGDQVAGVKEPVRLGRNNAVFSDDVMPAENQIGGGLPYIAGRVDIARNAAARLDLHKAGPV